jgi:hypothetical protein
MITSGGALRRAANHASTHHFILGHPIPVHDKKLEADLKITGYWSALMMFT